MRRKQTAPILQHGHKADPEAQLEWQQWLIDKWPANLQIKLGLSAQNEALEACPSCDELEAFHEHEKIFLGPGLFDGCTSASFPVPPTYAGARLHAVPLNADTVGSVLVYRPHFVLRASVTSRTQAASFVCAVQRAVTNGLAYLAPLVGSWHHNHTLRLLMMPSKAALKGSSQEVPVLLCYFIPFRARAPLCGLLEEWGAPPVPSAQATGDASSGQVSQQLAVTSTSASNTAVQPPSIQGKEAERREKLGQAVHHAIQQLANGKRTAVRPDWQRTHIQQLEEYGEALHPIAKLDRTMLSVEPGVCLEELSPHFTYVTTNYMWSEQQGGYIPQPPPEELDNGCECDPNRCAGEGARRAVRHLRKHGLAHRLEIRRSANLGLGVYAQEDIRVGSFIMEYVGEMEVGKSRDAALYDDRVWNYIFDVSNPYDLFCLPENQAFIDATFIGNVSRFINHRCGDPNCRPVEVCCGRIAHLGADGMLILIQAVRDIKKGEELNFSYGVPVKGQENKKGILKCRCGSALCTGWVFPAAKLQQRYGSVAAGRPVPSRPSGSGQQGTWGTSQTLPTSQQRDKSRPGIRTIRTAHKSVACNPPSAPLQAAKAAVPQQVQCAIGERGGLVIEADNGVGASHERQHLDTAADDAYPSEGTGTATTAREHRRSGGAGSHQGDGSGVSSSANAAAAAAAEQAAQDASGTRAGLVRAEGSTGGMPLQNGCAWQAVYAGSPTAVEGGDQTGATAAPQDDFTGSGSRQDALPGASSGGSAGGVGPSSQPGQHKQAAQTHKHARRPQKVPKRS